LNNYRTIAATDTKASTKELELELLRQANRCKDNREASGESIERHELHSNEIPLNRFLGIVVSRAMRAQRSYEPERDRGLVNVFAGRFHVQF
jgi:hypothetical protein